VNVKDKFIGIAAVLIFVAVGIFVFSAWEVGKNRQRDEQCKAAREHLKAIEIQARAMATGLSIESYAEAENNEVGKLINALETAKNKEEAEAVITEHSATVKAQVAATEAEVKSRGGQPFLVQQLKEPRITTDVKLGIKRAEKAVRIACE
jgi:CHASE3 domain sensor protein